mgnify:CR=1 FL=1
MTAKALSERRPAGVPSPRLLVTLLTLVVAVRVATLPLYPLVDPSESRYAEIAREMAATGDWITPRIDGGRPFWAKPPLGIWASAASLRVFGSSEAAVRLPGLLFFAGTALLLLAAGRRLTDRATALAGVVVYASAVLPFALAGTVMTDPALVFATTLSMAAFVLARDAEARGAAGRGARIAWGLAFFVGLGLGLLAKGPVALVLTLVPLGAWALLCGEVRRTWRALPWLAGPPLALAIALPWYLAAERATPGFLEYFLVGEHFRRFVDKDWHGDLYGAPRVKPYGTIWALWVAAALPWCIPLGVRALRRVPHVRTWPGALRGATARLRGEPERALLVAFALAPLLFFTPASAVIMTYVGPGLPAFALLAARALRGGDGRPAAGPRAFAAWALALPCAFLALVLVPPARAQLFEHSHVRLVALWRAHADDGSVLAYACSVPESAAYYSAGTARPLADAPAEAWQALLDTPACDFVVTKRDDGGPALRLFRRAAKKIATCGDYALWLEDGTQPRGQ